MRRLMFVLLVGGLSVLQACAPATRAYWVNPSRGLASLDQDKYECTREASMVPRMPYPTAPPTTRGTGFAAGFQDGLNRGVYYQGIAAAQASEERASELFGLCMKARGYGIERRAQ